MFGFDALATPLAGKREGERLGIPESAVEAIVRAFCFVGRETSVHFRLRPVLPDPGDGFLLELAVAGAADAIVVSAAIANRLASREYIESRASLFIREELALQAIPDVEPDEHDQL